MKILKSDATRLIYVPNPKAASTSIYKVMVTLSGVDLAVPVRRALRTSRFADDIRAAGVETILVDTRKIVEFRKAHREYVWFTFVRDPYDRVVSNYHNKLNRFAAEFQRGAYLSAKLRQLAMGPKAWQSHLVCVDYLKGVISFEDYVRGLGEHGVEFDAHFRPQTEVLRVPRLRYDFVGRVERFGDDIRSVAERAGRAGVLDEAALPRENASRREKSDPYSPELRAIVHRLYRSDFEEFGYEA
ncbi:MAG TPA: sulfotransferase family protein [Bauldia sp.]|nr:sulfotransferase family protein [Bauldia sp.]